MEVTLRYFDGCPNWKEAQAHLEVLGDEGFHLEIGHQLIDTPELAAQVGFRGSPTILLNGADPFADPDAPVGLTCRVYQTDTGFDGSPSIDQLRAAIEAAE